jgi:hypothetical protein
MFVFYTQFIFFFFPSGIPGTACYIISIHSEQRLPFTFLGILYKVKEENLHGGGHACL